MSSQNNLSLEEAFKQLAQEVELEFIDISKKAVIEESREIANEIQVKYDAFFEYIATRLIGRNDAPGWFARYLPGGEWADITSKWSNTKNRVLGGLGDNYNSYYMGISRSTTQANRLSVRKNDGGVSRVGNPKRRKSGKVGVQPFADYIRTLQTAGTTERFFGPVTLQYEIQSPQIGHVVSTKMGHKTLTDNISNNTIRNIYAKNTQAYRKPLIALPRDMQITARVEAFGNLKDIADSEWALVDFIIKRIDPQNEKQWVKINGRTGGHGRGNRPIRAVIAPMIKWYLEKLLPDAIKGM